MKFTTAALNLLAGATIAQAEQVLITGLWGTAKGDLATGDFTSNGVFFKIDRYDCEGRFVGPDVSDRISNACVEIINEDRVDPVQFDFTLSGYTPDNYDVTITLWHTYEDGVERTGSGTVSVSCFDNGAPNIMCNGNSGVWITLE